MASFENLHTIFKAAMQLAATDSGVLLGQPLEMEAEESLSIDRVGFLGEKEDPFFVTTVESGGEYPGELYLLFSFRDAILLSGLLLGIQPARIEEKRRLAIMEPDDGDAFAEILNQVIGSFNSGLTTTLPQKVHLKLQPPRKFIPGTDVLSDLEPMSEGEYCLFRYRLKLEGTKTDNLDILIPLALAKLFDPQEEDSVALEPEPAELSQVIENENNNAVEPKQTILIFEDDPSDMAQTMEILSAAGLKPIDATHSSDFIALCPDGSAAMAVVGVADADEQDTALRTRIKALCQSAPFPVLLCAKRWTRTAIIKVLSYGAKEIILRPYDSDILVDRVNKLLKAA